MVVLQGNHNGLATEWLVSVLVALTTDFLRAARKFVLDQDRQGLGREILGDVPDRETSEDEHAGIDDHSEALLVVYCTEAYRKHGVTFWICSEHYPQGYGVGCKSPDEAYVECFVDPFDGTDQYLKGIREAWWSVLSFSYKGTSIVAGAVDILGGTIYRAYNGHQDKIDIRSNRREEVSPRREVALDRGSVVASYKGRWRYFSPWVEYVQHLFGKEELAGITHYGNGGSFVYALLAAGILSVYIMDEEPISEITPGEGFVESAGLCLLVVKDGVISRFVPNRRMAGRVDGIFIAGCTEEVAFWVAERLA